MYIEGKFRYYKALVLTPDRIDELCKILNKYFESIRFEAETFDKHKIYFDSKEELIAYENFGKSRLKNLTVSCYDSSQKNIYIYFDYLGRAFSFLGYYSTVKVHYNLPTIEIERNLKCELTNLFEKSKSGNWLIGKFSAWGFWAAISFVTSAIGLCINPTQLSNTTEPKTIIWGIVFAIAILIITLLFDCQIMGRLFIPVVFCFGEEKLRQEKLGKFRSNFFWCVIIAIIVGVITTFMCNIIFY